jgi:hypothetical protein
MSNFESFGCAQDKLRIGNFEWEMLHFIQHDNGIWDLRLRGVRIRTRGGAGG